MMGVLKRMFSRDQAKRLDDVDHRAALAQRRLDASVADMGKATIKFHQVKRDVIDEQMVGMIRELSATMDNR